MKKFAIVCRGDNESKKLKDIIINELNDSFIYDEKNPDLVISVGGDGTMLTCVHQYQYLLDKVCFVGLHTGTLGKKSIWN
jgi:NAD+ kinase